MTRRLGRRTHERRTEERTAEEALEAKMGGFWDHDLGMEDECQRIMESIRGEEGNKGIKAGASGGRIWVCLAAPLLVLVNRVRVGNGWIRGTGGCEVGVGRCVGWWEWCLVPM